MLFSLSKKFLFIANLKTASTAIERVLAPHAELRLLQSQYGKHQTYLQFTENFKWLAGRADARELFIFGVIRDPIGYALSVFNFHAKNEFRGQPNFTGNMDFARFVSTWVPKFADQMKPQISRFVDARGKLVTNLLISYDRLQEGLDIVADRLDIPALRNLPRDNESPRVVGRSDLSAEQIAWIEERSRTDTEAIAQYANKPIRFD